MPRFTRPSGSTQVANTGLAFSSTRNYGCFSTLFTSWLLRQILPVPYRTSGLWQDIYICFASFASPFNGTPLGLGGGFLARSFKTYKTGPIRVRQAAIPSLLFRLTNVGVAEHLH